MKLSTFVAAIIALGYLHFFTHRESPDIKHLMHISKSIVRAVYEGRSLDLFEINRDLDVIGVECFDAKPHQPEIRQVFQCVVSGNLRTLFRARGAFLIEIKIDNSIEIKEISSYW